MKLLALSSVSAAMLLLSGVGTTAISAASRMDHAADDKFGRNELALTDTSTIKIGNTRAGTTAIPPPDIRPYGALVLAGISDYNGEARHNMYEAFSEIQRLTMVPTGLAVSFDKEGKGKNGGDEGFEWTRFERESATRPNQFIARFWNALLYVCHIITVDHIRALRFGRGSRGFGRYRYRYRSRLGNPNNTRNRRLRCISRLTVNIDRMLWDAWSQMIGFLLLLIVRRRGESVESRASPRNWFPQAPSAARGTATLLLGYYATAAAAAQRLTLRTVLRLILRAVPLVGLITSPLTGPFCYQLSRRLGRELLKSIVKLISKRVTKLLVKLLLVLQDSESRAAPPEPREAPPAAPVLFRAPSAAPCTIFAAAPLLLEQPAAPRLFSAPTPLPVILPAAVLRILPVAAPPVRPPSVLPRILPAAPLLKHPAAPLLLDPPAATLVRFPGAAPLELRAAAVLGVDKLMAPVISPRLIIPAFLRSILPAAAPQLEPPAAPLPPALQGAQRPREPGIEAAAHSEAVRRSSVAKTFVVMDLYKSDSMEIPKRSWGDTLEAGVDGLAEACRPSERVPVRWISVKAVERHPFCGYAQDYEHAAVATYRGMRFDKKAVLGAFVRWASPPVWLQRSTIKGQPLQLQRGQGNSSKGSRRQSSTARTWLRDESMTALYENLFMSAVFTLSMRQGLYRHAVRRIIHKTLKAGDNGLTISLWEMHSLPNIAVSDCKKNRDATSDNACIRSRLVSAGRTIKTFIDLSRLAPMALSSFGDGYETAVFGQVR